VTTGQDGRARLFDSTATQLAELGGGDEWPEQLAWSPTGERLAVARGRVASIWSQSGECIFETAPQESTITGMGWDRSGSTLALACYGGVQLVDAKSGAPVRRLPWRGSLISLAWSPDGRVIACATQECAVHFWRLTTGKDSEMSGFPSKPRALAWDAEGKSLATGGDAVVSVWSFRGKGPEGKPPQLLTGHQALCTTLAFHPCRPRLASGSDDTTVLVWAPSSGNRPTARASLSETVTSLQWARSGSVLVAADAAGRIEAWREP
jgi:WD40 repeat protein